MEQTIYDQLKEDILLLRMKPGLSFSIKDLCNVYGVGRSPVRDALIRLEKEKLIEFLPQKNTQVSLIHYRRAMNEQYLRRCVEENVVMEFAAVAGISAIHELERALYIQQELLLKKDMRALIQADDHFHAIFYKYTDHAYCGQLVEECAGDYFRLRLMELTHCDCADDIVKAHESLITGIKGRDTKEIARVLSAHLTIPHQHERLLLKDYADVFDAAEEEREDTVGAEMDYLFESQKYSS